MIRNKIPKNRVIFFTIFIRKYIFIRKIGFSFLWNNQFYVKCNIKQNICIFFCKMDFLFFCIPRSRRFGHSVPNFFKIEQNDASIYIRHIVCFRRQKTIKIFSLEFWRPKIVFLNFSDFSHVLYKRYDVSKNWEQQFPNRRLGDILKKNHFS